MPVPRARDSQAPSVPCPTEGVKECLATRRDPQPSGPQKGTHASQKEYWRLLDIYYAKRGWDVEGNPPIAPNLRQA